MTCFGAALTRTLTLDGFLIVPRPCATANVPTLRATSSVPAPLTTGAALTLWVFVLPDEELFFLPSLGSVLVAALLSPSSSPSSPPPARVGRVMTPPDKKHCEHHHRNGDERVGLGLLEQLLDRLSDLLHAVPSVELLRRRILSPCGDPRVVAPRAPRHAPPPRATIARARYGSTRPSAKLERASGPLDTAG